MKAILPDIMQRLDWSLL